MVRIGFLPKKRFYYDSYLLKFCFFPKRFRKGKTVIFEEMGRLYTGYLGMTLRNPWILSVPVFSNNREFKIEHYC